MDRLYLPRRAENLILEWLTFFPAVVIIGPRQVGKTSLTTAIRNQAQKVSLYLDLERRQDLATVDDLESFAEGNLGRLLILDEVQRKPSLFPDLRSVIDRNRQPGRFILLGSASLELIRDASESLAGRIAILELSGFTLDELSGTAGYDRHWLRGGFPEAQLAPTDPLSYEWRQSFLRTYLERDLPYFGLTASPTVTGRLLTMLAHLTGQQLNLQSLSRSLGLDARTLGTYLDFLEETFLIRRLLPYFVNVGKRLVKSPKVYVRDTGLLHALLDIETRNELLGHPVIGASFEAYIVEQLHALAPRGYTIYYYRTQNGAEMDAVLIKGGTVKAVIEIKNRVDPKLTRGFHTSRSDLGDPPAFVVVPGAGVEYSIKGYKDLSVISPEKLTGVF